MLNINQSAALFISFDKMVSALHRAYCTLHFDGTLGIKQESVCLQKIFLYVGKEDTLMDTFSIEHNIFFKFFNGFE